MLPNPIPAIDVVEHEAPDDTPSSFWLLAVTAGGVLAIFGSYYIVGAILIGVTG